MEGIQPPRDWLLSRICEEFSCTPMEALRQPLELTLSIISLRAYARAYYAAKQGKDATRPLRTNERDIPPGLELESVEE